jgi:hypothetical protein
MTEKSQGSDCCPGFFNPAYPGLDMTRCSAIVQATPLKASLNNPLQANS